MVAFQTELEKGILERITDSLQQCNQYMDKIFRVKLRNIYVPDVLEELRWAHGPLDFKLKMRTENRLAFLNVLMIRLKNEFMFTENRLEMVSTQISAVLCN